MFYRLFRVLKALWAKLGSVLREVIIALTFLSMFPVFVFTMYYLFWDFDLLRVLAGVVVFRVMMKCNAEL